MYKRQSVGGVLETAILGLPAGVGEPYFDSVESKLAHLAFSLSLIHISTGVVLMMICAPVVRA